MLLVDPASLPPDLWGFVRSAMQFLQHGLLCLTAYLASAGLLQGTQGNMGLGVQGVGAQYLLGLGECSSPPSRTSSVTSRRAQAWGTSPGSYLLSTVIV